MIFGFDSPFIIVNGVASLRPFLTNEKSHYYAKINTMPKLLMKQRILTTLAGVVLLAVTAWLGQMVSPVVGLLFLLGSVWFIVKGFENEKSALRTASIVILSIAGVVAVLTTAYFVWIGGFNN